MDAPIDLSVITATYRRPKHLEACLAQFQRQSLGGLRVEQIVVSDGPDEYARGQVESLGLRFDAVPHSGQQWGAAAKDRGIELAQGDYVCFWDDDNLYEPHALVTLFAAAQGFDIGVVQCRYLERRHPGRRVLPARWDGRFQYGDIDTMNFCVRREVALTERWADGNRRSGEDYRWIQRLVERGATVRYVPIVIGEHV
jgi:glycosyltransferase involved in cell wall biosynthesis